MANRFLGEVEVEHAGRTWTLRLDFNALCEFEEATGVDALSSLARLEEGKMGAKQMRALMWAMLRRHQPNVTMDDAGDLLSHRLDALQLCARAAVPAPDKADKPGKAPRRR